MAASCPNTNLPEWNTLVEAVGQLEAYKDFMETGGEIRTPKEVQRKIVQRASRTEESLVINPDTASINEVAYKTTDIADVSPIGLNTDKLKQTKAIEFASKLSDTLGLKWQIISKNEALQLTKNTVNPYNGAPAFFLGDKVYFIQDRMTSDLVLHEFAHPFIETIAIENPQLFDNLYNQLQRTEEGQSIIASVQKSDATLPDKFKKAEALVRALTAAGKMDSKNMRPNSLFARVINNIMYAIKQLSRKMFGMDINISKINPSTSLNELSEILQSGGRIKINTEVIDEKSIVRYNNDVNDQVFDEALTLRQQDIQSIINLFHDNTVGQIQELLGQDGDNKYYELAKILKDPVYDRGDLDAIRANLAKWQTSVKKKAETLVSQMGESDKRVRALVDSLFKLETVVENVLDHLRNMKENPDPIENMNKAYYYNHLIEQWGSFMVTIKEVITDPENNLPSRSAFSSMINDISNNIDRSRKEIDKMYSNGGREAIYSALEPMKRGLQQKFNEDLAYLESKGVKGERIDKLYRDFHGMNKAEHKTFMALAKKQKSGLLTVQDQKVLKELTKKSMDGLSISPEKIEVLMEGQMKDAHWFNSYLEGYLYNTDPVIGGLALYVKNALNDVMIVTQRKFNTFAEDIRQDLIDAGYNPNKIGDLGKRMGFKDTILVRGEDGELEEKRVWSFLDKFQNERSEDTRLKEMLRVASLQYKTQPNAETEAKLKAVKAEVSEQRALFWNQKYAPEVYAAQDLLTKDDIGKQAAFVRDNFFDELNNLSDKANKIGDIAGIEDEIALKWREWALMHSRLDLNGNLKTGMEAEVSQRLRDVREASGRFRENVLRKGVFETKYLEKVQELKAEKLSASEYDNRLEQWLKSNTRYAIKSDFYARRGAIIESIKSIMQKLDSSERDEIDQTEIWETILGMTKPFKDESGQVDASQMTKDALDTLHDLENQLEAIKKKALRASGLTLEQSEELSKLYDDKKNGRSYSQSRIQYLMDLKASQKSKLTKTDRQTLEANYAELRKLSTNIATDMYVDIVNNYLSKLDIGILKNQYGPEFNNISKTDADFILDPTIVEELTSQSPEFKDWFNKNHIKSTKTVKKNGKYVTVDVYKRGYAWSVVKPNDPAMLESFPVKNALGGVEAVIPGLPAMTYYTRKVKRIYTTPKIIGTTVDNKGRWLPKSKEEMSKVEGLNDEEKYKLINEKYYSMDRNSAEFRLLEKLKKHHLDNQVGIDRNSKLYLDMPRYRMSNLEVGQTLTLSQAQQKGSNLFTYIAQRWKEFIYGAKDDSSELGMNYSSQQNIMRADMFDNDVTKVPVSGLFDIDIDDVSTDVTTGMMRYMMSVERQKQLIGISPVVRAIQSTVKTNVEKNIGGTEALQGDDDADEMNKRNFLARIMTRFKSPSSKNVRLNAINNFIEKNFEGVNQVGWGSDSAIINNISNVLFKRASFSFFALNIPSALKNSLGMKFNSMMFASGGEHIDHLNLQKGNAWSYKMMGKLSFGGELYNKGAKDHMLQLVEIFDPVQGLFEQQFGESLSRTAAKDAASGSWLYSFRKWVEKQAGVQMFAGMLYKQKINQMVDGNMTEISYIDAFETINNQIRLKDGIDVRYGTEAISAVVKKGDSVEALAKKYYTTEDVIRKALGNNTIDAKLDTIDAINDSRNFELEQVGLDTITDPNERTLALDEVNKINERYDKQVIDKGSYNIDNSEFKFHKNRIQQVQNDLGGAYASFDQPEAQRYLAFRYISYMRRYFTTMFTKRMGHSGSFLNPRKRFNAGRGNAEMGFYMQTLETMKDIFKSRGEHINSMLPEEKSAMLQFASEIAFLVAVSLLMGAIFGWDEDDEDRMKKLRSLQGGSLGSDDFDAMGWAQVHALHLMMQVRSENEQFNFFTGGLKQYNSLLDLKSVAFGPTTDAYITILDDIKYTLTGDERAAYSRDVGPYSWQQKGGSKWINHAAKMFGITGTSMDPALAVQNFQAYQAKARR